MQKRNLEFEKSFKEVGAYSNDTKVFLTGQKGWAWVQLEHNGNQNSVKSHGYLKGMAALLAILKHWKMPILRSFHITKFLH